MTELVERLKRDVIAALKSGEMKMSRDEIRYLVDTYYQIQKVRQQSGNQEFAQSKEPEPCFVVSYLHDQLTVLENQLVRVFDAWTDQHRVGVWAKEQYGIGPVIAAGLLAHIDIEKAPHVGHILSFAGQVPPDLIKWEKGQKRPFNLKLKVLCWKIGDSFCKFSGRDECYYGKLYRKRKELEVQNNESGGNAECAKATLEKKKIREKATRLCYDNGKLPPGRVDLRARRWAVKIFLSHWHMVAYWDRWHVVPPMPYPIAHLGHADLLMPPGITEWR